jgi:hypothetical protein
MLHPGFYLHLPAWMQGGPDVRLGCTDKLDLGQLKIDPPLNGMARVS